MVVDAPVAGDHEHHRVRRLCPAHPRERNRAGDGRGKVHHAAQRDRSRQAVIGDHRGGSLRGLGVAKRAGVRKDRRGAGVVHDAEARRGVSVDDVDRRVVAVVGGERQVVQGVGAEVGHDVVVAGLARMRPHEHPVEVDAGGLRRQRRGGVVAAEDRELLYLRGGDPLRGGPVLDHVERGGLADMQRIERAARAPPRRPRRAGRHRYTRHTAARRVNGSPSAPC